MPSIEQCDGAAGSVAALPSTLEIFDTFKSAAQNEKDSDSEESIHLRLSDDDDIENQSVVSNGRDKEIHNEETEDDIMNKFETCGTPDQMDSRIEDSILNDDDDHLLENKPQKQTNTEIKITYNFEEYENSGDGEFKSVYETDADPELTDEKEESKEAVESITSIYESDDVGPELTAEKEGPKEAVEPMEVGEEPEMAKETNQDLPNYDGTKKDSGKEVESFENFEDCMEVVQEDTNQDIASIIEKLEDQDVPMEAVESADKKIDSCSEFKVVETDSKSDSSNLEINITKDCQKVAGKDLSPIDADDNDVEMSADCSQDQQKDNLQQGDSSTTEETFQASTDEPKTSSETCTGETEIQVSLDPEITDFAEKDCRVDKEPVEEPANVEDPKPLKENHVDDPKPLKENLKIDLLKEDLPEPLSACDEQVISKEDNNYVDVDNASNEKDALALEDSLLNEPDEISKETNTEEAKECIANPNSLSELSKNSDKEVFKVPEEFPKELEVQRLEGPDLSSEKSNDKTDDDEVDLLDISMVRETEEDDACAIADAIQDSSAMEDTDKETLASEKSDEEQSEKMETELESSDLDKDHESNDDNDNTMGFDDIDEDSQLDGEDSSNADPSERPKSKIVEILESSKDNSSDGESKQTKICTESANVASAEKHEDAKDQEKSTAGEVTNQSSVTSEDAQPLTTTEEKVESEGSGETEPSDTKTDEGSDKDVNKTPTEVSDEAVSETVSERGTENSTGFSKPPTLNKRSYSERDIKDNEVSAKKPKLATEPQKPKETSEVDTITKPCEKIPDTETPSAAEKVKTLTAFSKFMQCRKFTTKLSRSDLEQFCIQKICESLMLKSTEGELHQANKKHEKTIDNLRKDIQQLTKQCKDLEIVNKKLMNELRNQNALKKPLVPLKITRSVGLQVRLNPGNEIANQNRRRQPMATTPQKQVTASNAVASRAKATSGNQQPTAVRQVMQVSPQKSPLTTGQTTTNNAPTPMLSQALQKRQTAVLAKRTTPVRKPAEAAKPGNPGVIDLTDEDDKLAQAKTVGSTIKILNKTVSPAGTPNKAVNKMGTGGKTAGKQVTVSKAVAVGQNKGNTLSQGIRLTPTSVITSNANGSPQMVYVVPTITSNAGGQQKVAFVNFQPTNGVLSGTLGGSIMSNKSGQTLTLKTMPTTLRHKHPAPLPTTPRISLDPKLKPLLPKPLLTIKKIETGIILQWKMPYNLDTYESIASYQLYAYQETSSPPSTDMWRKVGDVKALALPMACTLTQFADKNKYYFAVRSVDVHKRIGAFSDPEEISL